MNQPKRAAVAMWFRTVNPAAHVDERTADVEWRGVARPNVGDDGPAMVRLFYESTGYDPNVNHVAEFRRWLVS